MGVNAGSYLIFGYKVAYDSKKYDLDCCEKYCEDIHYYRGKEAEGKFGLLKDGMSGNYVIWGIVVKRLDDYGYIDIPHTEIDPQEIAKKIVELSALLSEEVKKAGLNFEESPKLMLLTHYS